ncbi:hypothetical protein CAUPRSCDRAFT_11844 [Caulochytrium protostelioides]|uniref:Uncharacterized protein n=1 Tax=Caulochytrium protostelioides TaxID=1555241 RepID=A0A4P9WVD7_9FUNG|nr:hypothetical protein CAUPRSCDRAFT_11844 [Caulochytrium protostelioides]
MGRLPVNKISINTNQFFRDFQVYKSNYEEWPEDDILFNQSGVYIAFRKDKSHDYAVAVYAGKATNLAVRLRNQDHRKVKSVGLILVYFTEFPAAYEELMLGTFQFRWNLNSNHFYAGEHGTVQPDEQLICKMRWAQFGTIPAQW